MNWDQIKDNWPQVKSNIRARFDKLTDEDINNIRENFRDRLVERLQNRYGYTREDAQKRLDEVVNTLKTPAKV